MDSSSNAPSWPAPPARGLSPIASVGAAASAAAADYSANLAARGWSSSITGPRTPAESGTRHGSRSGRRSASARSERSRSQDEEGEGPIRAVPAGPQERLDWLEAMSLTKNAVDTVERQSRKHAQDMAATEARVQELNERLVKLENLGIEPRMNHMEERISEVSQKGDLTATHLLEACSNIWKKFVTVDDNKDLENMLDAKIDSISATMQAIMSTVASMEFPRRPAPEEYDLTTPLQQPTERLPPPIPPGMGVDPMRANDPWNRTGARTAENTAVPGSPFRSHQEEARQEAQARQEARQPEPPQPAPRMPQQHAPGGQPIPPRPNWEDMPHSPFENSYTSPQPGRPQRPNAQGHSQGHSDEYMGNQKTMNRENKSMYAFSGHSADFKNWRNRFVDHMAMVHCSWRNALLWLGTTKTDLSYATIGQEAMGPLSENANELAVKLEQTICNYLPVGLYDKRIQLCGGIQEASNGFKMWRRLHEDHTGSGEIISFAGSECLR